LWDDTEYSEIPDGVCVKNIVFTVKEDVVRRSFSITVDDGTKHPKEQLEVVKR
jgi:hypothetical protein